ncbi:MAG: exo-alpha-sialidase [SAR202 cluster bacterium]|nr:exo-alpha-sialidase [SAR202 cluster bacterium]
MSNRPWFRETEIFAQGLDGYHTYRIPALVTTPRGTMLAFCEGRKYDHSDWGEIHIVLRRSMDGGASWGAMSVVHSDGEHTIGNPCPIVDRDTGRVWLVYCWDNDRVFVMHSDDDGVSWAAPREITGDVKPAGWTWYGTGPGHGIQARSGRLIVPSDHRQGTRQGWPLFRSHVVYTDDHGATWKAGADIAPWTDECMAVESEDGRT